MAALQTLRNKPALLMSVIGGALLLFIVTLTDLNSCSNPNVTAEVNGQELMYPDYEGEIRQEENVVSLIQGNVSDEQKNEIREVVWNNYVNGQLIGKEAAALGLTVSKEEVQDALANFSVNQLQYYMQMVQQGRMSMVQLPSAAKIMLLMSMVGQPSAEGYKQFMKTADQQIAQYQKQNPEVAEAFYKIKDACLYLEKQLPRELLVQKYQALLACGIVSNPVSAKMSFDAANTNYDVELVTIPFASVEDKDIKVTDEDLKKKYEELKPMFRLSTPTRDLKFIHVAVTPSTKDQDNILAGVKAIEDTLRKVSGAKAVEAVMKLSKSEVDYQNVFLPKDAFQPISSVYAALDSMAVGAVSATAVETARPGEQQYVSAFKLVAKKTSADSMQVCQFVAESKQLADSVVAAVKGGAALSAIAKKYPALVQKYNLKGDTTWIDTKYYVEASADNDSVAGAYTNVCQIPAGTTAYYTQTAPDGKSLYVVAEVLAAKAPSEKFNMAIMRSPLKFSNETYNNQRRQLSEFLAKNKTIEAIEKNASKAGYTVMSQPNTSTTDAMSIRMRLGGENGAKQAFIWAFDEAEAGQVSPMVYECGTNNDQLLVVCVSGINDDDYLAWNNANVKQTLESLVKQDKKAEKIMDATKNVKDINAAKAAKGAQYQAIPTMSLAQLSQSEPSLAGALERTAKGKFTGAVKGANAIYMAKVSDKKSSQVPYNAKQALFNDAQSNAYAIFGRDGSVIFNALMKDMKIVDKRYKF